SSVGVWCLVFSVLGRTVLYSYERSARRCRRVGAARVLLVGDGSTMVELAQRIRRRPELGLDVVGVLTHARVSLPVPVLGTLPDLARVVREQRASTVILAFPLATEEEVLHAVRASIRAGLAVYAVAPGFHFGLRTGPRMDTAWGIALTFLGPAPGLAVTRKVKRLMDICFAVAVLLLLLPVIAVVAVAVRVEVGAGIIFRQVRIGQGGRRFEVLKFRSIRRISEAESDTTWSVVGDSRIGPVGRRIRRWSLDELPQLVNVLRGDMSLVGPRPERPYFVDHYERTIPGYSERHRGPAGLTGYAAVNGLRGDTSIEDRSYFDNLYLDNWSLWFDVKILLRTVASVLKGSNG
ncbi:MAG: exopolysaccharide biosynthesis polyprenyl glycosylphosphotransferase, partial [Microlunatus sp.]|nr:exopolysaccharide biosynthesis polyprenyl glycosylphosphotransferase [Microlunatus sp.]